MKKTREYYKELLDLGYVKGRKLSKEEKQLFMKQQQSGSSPDNIVWASDTTDDLYEIEEPDGEEFMKKSQLLMIRHLRTIKRCLVFIVVLIAIGLGIAALAGFTAITQAANADVYNSVL